jgi:hypothetical protein
MAKKLPKKLSDCLAIAIADLTAVEKQKSKYVVDMRSWHGPELDDFGWETTGKCAVCFAGAVMARTLETTPDKDAIPGDFGRYNAQRFSALDALRTGSLAEALYCVGIKETPFGLSSDVTVDEYECNPIAFKKDMKKVEALLRRFDL